jgi:hypothetical protein
MSAEGIMCLAILVVPMLAGVLIFFGLPSRRSASFKCPSCQGQMSEVTGVWPTTEAAGVPVDGRAFQCTQCGHREYLPPTLDTVTALEESSWLRRRFMPTIWEKAQDEQEFWDKIDLTEARPRRRTRSWKD